MLGKTPEKQRGEITRSRPQLSLYSFGMEILTNMWAWLSLRGFTPRKDTFVKDILSYYAENERTNLTLF